MHIPVTLHNVILQLSHMNSSTHKQYEQIFGTKDELSMSHCHFIHVRLVFHFMAGHICFDKSVQYVTKISRHPSITHVRFSILQ